MALPSPTLIVVHAVMGPPNPLLRDAGTDERFMAAVRTEFPNVLARQLLPPEAPPPVPHLTLASTSSQLALSAAQADFEVRFYGQFIEDTTKALGYVQQKLLAVLAGFKSIEVVPATLGLVATLNFSFETMDTTATEYLLRTHLKTDVEAGDVQDATARVALKVRDTYFVSLSVGNYESRRIERPIFPGAQVVIRPWEGKVEDAGIELKIDINNQLESRVKQADPEVTEDGVRAVLGLLEATVLTSGPEFAATGSLSVDSLVERSQA